MEKREVIRETMKHVAMEISRESWGFNSGLGLVTND